MSNDKGTTPIIADLKGRRVLVTGNSFIVAETLLCGTMSLRAHRCCPTVVLPSRHAEVLRHDAIRVNGKDFQPRTQK